MPPSHFVSSWVSACSSSRLPDVGKDPSGPESSGTIYWAYASWFDPAPMGCYATVLENHSQLLREALSEEQIGMVPSTVRKANWWKRCSIGVFLFFLIKGMLWLIIPAALVMASR